MSFRIAVYTKENSQAAKKELTDQRKNMKQADIAAETILGEPKRKSTRGLGGNIKVKVLTDKFASVTDPKTGKTQKTEITRVVKNGANVDYNRRGVITKGAEIETALGSCKSYQSPRQRRRNQRSLNCRQRKSIKIFFFTLFAVAAFLIFTNCFAIF